MFFWGGNKCVCYIVFPGESPEVHTHASACAYSLTYTGLIDLVKINSLCMQKIEGF